MGILITSTRVTARKLLQEAKQCLKCQRFGTSHLAAQCTQPTDTCRTCGSKSHHSQACQIVDPAQFHCPSCDKHGQTSWDCNCPTFKEHNDKLQQRNQESNMHFYPSSKDPQSWEAITTTKEDNWPFKPLPPPTRFCPAAHPTPLHAPPPHLNVEPSQCNTTHRNSRPFNNTQQGRAQTQTHSSTIRNN